jgi:hypothetical protein
MTHAGLAAKAKPIMIAETASTELGGDSTRQHSLTSVRFCLSDSTPSDTLEETRMEALEQLLWRATPPVGRFSARARVLPIALALAGALLAGGCTEMLDAGRNRPRGLLPVDERSPVLLINDGAYDNWSGEYAVLLANGAGPALAGIIVNENSDWPDIQTNVDGWRGLVAAARASGLKNIPDPIASIGSQLVMPASGDIDATQPNRSEGALFIVDASMRLGLSYRPLVIATGGALTDVADAYLVDPTVAQRVVIVSSLGSVTASGGGMGTPNGDRDPWADTIVAARFRYVQVSAFYDQLTDVPTSSLTQLPANSLGDWIAAKQPNLWHWSPASDQVAVLAVGLPTFASAVERVTPGAPLGAGATAGPDLATGADGSGWLVTGCDGTAATTRFWELLLQTH